MLPYILAILSFLPRLPVPRCKEILCRHHSPPRARHSAASPAASRRPGTKWRRPPRGGRASRGRAPRPCRSVAPAAAAPVQKKKSKNTKLMETSSLRCGKGSPGAGVGLNYGNLHRCSAPRLAVWPNIFHSRAPRSRCSETPLANNTSSQIFTAIRKLCTRRRRQQQQRRQGVTAHTA